MECRELFSLSVQSFPRISAHITTCKYTLEHINHWVRVNIYTYTEVHILLRNVNLVCCILFITKVQNNISYYVTIYNQHKETTYQSFYLLEKKIHNKNKFYVFFLTYLTIYFSLSKKSPIFVCDSFLSTRLCRLNVKSKKQKNHMEVLLNLACLRATVCCEKFTKMTAVWMQNRL